MPTPSDEHVKFASTSAIYENMVAHLLNQNFTLENVLFWSAITTGGVSLLFAALAAMMIKDGNPIGLPFLIVAGVLLTPGAIIEAGITVQQAVTRNPVPNDFLMDELLRLLHNLNSFEDYQFLYRLIKKIVDDYKPSITTSESSKELYEICHFYINHVETKSAFDDFEKCNEQYKECARQLESIERDRLGEREKELVKHKEELEAALLSAKEKLKNIICPVASFLSHYIAENNDARMRGKNAGKSLYNSAFRAFLELKYGNCYGQLIPRSFLENLTLKLDPASIVDALLRDQMPFSKEQMASMAKYKEEVYEVLRENPEKARDFYAKAFDEKGGIKKDNFAGVFVGQQRGVKAVSINSGACRNFWIHNQFLKAIDKLTEIGNINNLSEDQKNVYRKSIEAYAGKNKLPQFLSQLADEALKEKMNALFGELTTKKKEEAERSATKGKIAVKPDESKRKKEVTLFFLPAAEEVKASHPSEIVLGLT